MASLTPGDTIYVEHDERHEHWEYDSADPVKKGEHTVWHRPKDTGQQNKLSPGVDYKKIRIDKDAITIDTHGQRITIPHDGESSNGMRMGRIKDVGPIK